MTFPASFDWSVYNSTKDVVANFVLKADGQWLDDAGSSRGISNQLDRELLIYLRKQYAAVLVGGNTARREKYTNDSRFKTYVVTRQTSVTPEGLTRLQPADLQDLGVQIAEIKSKHGGLLVEAGPSLITQLLQLSVLSLVYLTVIGEYEDLDDLVLKGFGLKHFKTHSSQRVDDTTFLALEPIADPH